MCTLRWHGTDKDCHLQILVTSWEQFTCQINNLRHGNAKDIFLSRTVYKARCLSLSATRQTERDRQRGDMRLTGLLVQSRITGRLVKHTSRGNADLWSLLVASISPLQPSGYYMYHQFNIHKFYVLPTHCIYMCFVWISEQTAIISLYNIN